MNLSKLLPAILAASTLAGLAISSSANAAPDRDYIERAVPASSNPHEVFMRIVKVPKTQAVAESHRCGKMKDSAAMRGMCDRMMGDHQGAAPAPKD